MLTASGELPFVGREGEMDALRIWWRGKAPTPRMALVLGESGVGKTRLATAFGREIGCYVVNDPERMKHLAACGLWGFVTDVPDVAREALGPR